MSDEIECTLAFRRWCAEELVDPRLEAVLEEAFVNGWIAHAVITEATPAKRRALKRSVTAGAWQHAWSTP